jgi:type IV pilus assembly protein PilO
MDLKLDLNNLDVNNIGNWPAAARATVIALLCAVILGAGYYLDTSDQRLTLQRAEDKEKTLKGEYEKKQAKAANLDAYKQQMLEMERTFGALLQQLPGKTEVAELLVDISRIGIQSGLEFELFKPQAEVPKEFYSELPIDLRVIGTYHQFGNFASATAALSRIVTLHDLSIDVSNKKDKSAANQLVMSATARTYRYLDEKSEVKKDTSKARKGKK